MLKNCIAVIGQGAAPFRDALARLCADVLVLPPCPGMDLRVASHPDMLIMAIGQDVVVPRSAARRRISGARADSLPYNVPPYKRPLHSTSAG